MEVVAAGAAIGAGLWSAAGSIVGALGFTSSGIAAGSTAASMMSSAAVANGGGVAAGGLVATLQSVGAAGLGVVAGVGLVAGGAVIVGGGALFVKAYAAKTAAAASAASQAAAFGLAGKVVIAIVIAGVTYYLIVSHQRKHTDSDAAPLSDGWELVEVSEDDDSIELTKRQWFDDKENAIKAFEDSSSKRKAVLDPNGEGILTKGIQVLSPEHLQLECIPERTLEYSTQYERP